MSLQPGYSWSATTYGTRDGSGVPVGAYESVPRPPMRWSSHRGDVWLRRAAPGPAHDDHLDGGTSRTQRCPYRVALDRVTPDGVIVSRSYGTIRWSGGRRCRREEGLLRVQATPIMTYE